MVYYQDEDVLIRDMVPADARVITELSDLSQTAARIEAVLKPEGTGAA